MQKRPPMELETPHKTKPPSEAVRAHELVGLKNNCFLPPPNTTLRRFGKPSEDRRTWPLTRTEIINLYGWEEALKSFPFL